MMLLFSVLHSDVMQAAMPTPSATDRRALALARPALGVQAF
jgi:hypothetical protein